LPTETVFLSTSYTGMLNYLACRTRPDLAAAVSILSRFNQRPGLNHWKEVFHVWKYLLGTKGNPILYRCDLGRKSRNTNLPNWIIGILEDLSHILEQQETKKHNN
ncbi:hypothetical protein VP01_9952g1, partial [Puccinia sorghi]